MTKYDEMDKRIMEAVAKRSNPNSDPRCVEEGKRIADEERANDRYNCRPGYRVIDGRLQALRKQGKIAHYTKAEKNGAGGWHLGPNAIAHRTVEAEGRNGSGGATGCAAGGED